METENMAGHQDNQSGEFLDEGYVAYVHVYKRAKLVVQNEKKRIVGNEIEIVPAECISFENHIFVTNDKKVIKALESNKAQYGTKYKRIMNRTEYQLVMQYGQEHVRFQRGPATTKADKIRAHNVPVESRNIKDMTLSDE